MIQQSFANCGDMQSKLQNLSMHVTLREIGKGTRFIQTLQNGACRVESGDVGMGISGDMVIEIAPVAAGDRGTDRWHARRLRRARGGG
jgi:hypothetical protein